MEDAATSEISRAQVWQWLRHGKFSREDVARITNEELAKLADAPSPGAGGYEQARLLFDGVATGEEFVEFLTLPAYALLN
jgi:malate synthase